MRRGRHPYLGLPGHQFWNKEPGIRTPGAFDPVTDIPFRISQTEKVVTAGSCFAQHVAARLTECGFNHYIAEPAHPLVPAQVAQDHHYGLFSARYGNIYTARQLMQLLLRAYGEFEPVAKSWKGRASGKYVDPFRPQIQPGAFCSPEEVARDRSQHLAAVRRAVERMEVFVFTLGLTETWIDPRDGAVLPLAPGVAGGDHAEDPATFHNFDETETAQDLLAALRFIRSRNPSVKIILTVSPVPLNATYEDRHVYASTVWSKAVLRIAAERATRQIEDCCYFPSYEIITSPHLRGQYFAEDCREVLPAGVDHVMRLFFKHFAGAQMAQIPGESPTRDPEARSDHMAIMERKLKILCDEEMIGND